VAQTGRIKGQHEGHPERALLSEDRLRAFIEQSPLAVYIDRLDDASSNVYTSPQLEAILGYSVEEWVEDENLFLKVLHPDDRERVLAEHRRTRETGEPFRMEYRMIARDGRVRWFLDEARIVTQDPAGGPGYHYGYLLDITERKELEEAVSKAEEQYRRLVEQLPIGIYIDRLDEFSSNIYTSPQIERILGTSAEQWQNEPDLFVRLLHPDDRERVLAEHKRTHETGKPLRTEYRLIPEDGHVVWIRDEAVVVKDDAGDPLFLQGFLVDITERKATEQALRDSEAELRRQKAYYQQLHELSPVAIVTLDLEERVTSWNPTAETLFGYTQAEAVARVLDDLLFLTEALRREGREVSRQADEEGLAHRIARRARKDGSLVDVEILMVPLVVDGERTGYLVLYHDITEIQRAREEAEAATHAKSSFLATMSHEIRTPMNAVIGMGGLLMDTELTDEQRYYADVIRTSGEALLRIIDDILDLSKIEADKLELEEQPLDVRECVESALDLVAVPASQKKIELGCLLDEEVPAAIRGDPTRLWQALGNLLANAVKFTEVGEVVVAVTAVERGDGRSRLRFSVRDTGSGIPAERMHRLFESFSQLDASTTRHYGGTGLGLAISKRLAELMGGTLWAESEEGKGSTFHFEILAREAAAPPRPGSLGEPRITGKRLLVVDDSATNREIIRRQAEAWGMRVEAVEFPSDALVRIRRGDRFDAAVLDMHMPEMDGLALAREIRRYRDERALPLLLLTSIGRLAEARAAPEFAAQLTKPVKASSLYEALIRVFAAEAAPESKPGDAAADSRPGTAPLRLLVAEDNAINRRLALALLGKLGYRADAVENGHEALDALERQLYDVVLMDVQMPELDGLEATRRIRARFAPGEGPTIIATTANAMEADREECFAAGMDDHLSKPIRVDELSRALARCRPLAEARARATATEDSTIGSGEAVDGAALERLASSIGGGDEGRAAVGELIDAFLEDAPAEIAALRGAVERGDPEEARQVAHTLKSNGATFGAQAFSELCQKLEALGRHGGLDEAPVLLEQAEREWLRLREALEAFRAGRTPR
jgi:PAS domain S-box-containing protein